MPPKVSTTVFLTTIALLVSACGPGDAAPPTSLTTAPSVTVTTTTNAPTTTTPPDNTGGFGTPAQAPGEFDGLGSSAPLRAELRLAGDGCWYADINGDARLAVFPVGFEIPFSSDPTAIDSPDGVRYISGNQVDGAARVLFAGELPGGDAGRWSNHAAFCGTPDTQFVVFDEMRPAFDPNALDEDAIVALVDGAGFTVPWSCGRGWAVSTPDERVAIYIYQRGEDRLAAGATIELPDPDWRARLVVGEFLFSNHCDDVFESWEPSPVVAAEWMLDAGVIEVLDDFPSGMDPGSVRARLDGGVVVTDSGRRIPLPTIELINRGFNFFAG